MRRSQIVKGVIHNVGTAAHFDARKLILRERVFVWLLYTFGHHLRDFVKGVFAAYGLKNRGHIVASKVSRSESSIVVNDPKATLVFV